MTKFLMVTVVLMLVSLNVAAEPANIYVNRVEQDADLVYKQVFEALENNGYFVVFEPNIGKNLSHFAERWGANYNRNELETIRSMVFCSAWYANAVGNADADMLALCPLHITLTHKAGVTSILFVRPGRVAAGTAAESIATELEQDVIRTIESGVEKAVAR